MLLCNALNAQPVQWTVEARPTQVIESELPDGDVLLRVRSVLRRDDGALLIANGGSQRLYLMSKTGTVIAAFGRSGSGPGEFRLLGQAYWKSDGLIGALDMTLRTEQVFDRNGKFIRSMALTPLIEQMALERRPSFQFARADAWIVRASGRPDQRPGQIFHVPVDLHQLVGNRMATLGAFRSVEQQSSRDGSSSMIVPFGNNLMVAFTASHTVAGETSGDSLLVFDADGKRVNVIRVGAPRHRFTSAEHRKIRDSLIRVATRSPRTSPAWIEAVTDLRLPAILPAFKELIGDATGLIWVREHGWPVDHNRWTVYNVSGVPVARAQLPAGLRVTEIGRDYVLGVHHDEDDVETVQMHSLLRRAK